MDSKQEQLEGHAQACVAVRVPKHSKTQASLTSETYRNPNEPLALTRRAILVPPVL